MKRHILIGLAALAMVSVASGATSSSYENKIVLIAPSAGLPALPSVDATNFINDSAFIDNSLSLVLNTTLFLVQPYDTANTLNYTNYGVMGSLAGFQLDYFNTHLGSHFMAANIDNDVGAVLNCGGTNDGPYFTTNATFFFGAVSGGGALCIASATNIINRGTVEMGPDSLLSLHGQNVSLAGGLLNMEGFESGTAFGIIGVGGSGVAVLNGLGTYGMFDYYWGLGQTPNYNPASAFNFFPSSPLYWVTNRYYEAMETESSYPLATTYVNVITNAITVTTDGTNSTFGIGETFQVIFLQTADDANISHNAYFPGDSVVEWRWPATNIITGLVQTNHLFLEDYLIGISNLVLVTNMVGPPSTGYGWTYIPTNYFLYQGAFSMGTPATPVVPVNLFGPDTNNFTSQFAAYEAIFEPYTVIPGEVAGQTFTNMPGRIEVTADQQLDLRSSRISGLNYLRLTATNNIIQDRNTRILTPVADYNLGVTNATLTVSNLLAPSCPRINGFVNAWSTAWTNIPPAITNFTTTGGTNVYFFTNAYFITMVGSSLASSSPSFVQNLTLHATNVVISDVLTVVSNITIDAYNLLIATNGPGSQTPVGQLILPSGLPLDASALPRLRTLTNYGVISVQNLATFGSPAQPDWDFVNRGSVSAQGCSIWATNFESTGRIDSGPGPISLSSASAVLSHGTFNAIYSDIILGAGSLFVSDQVLNAGHSLTFWVTNSLSDGGPGSGNIWMAGQLGFNLPIKPPVGDLLGTTITDMAPAYAYVASQWAGQDRGPVVTGYSNNAALGRLILDGGNASSFTFNAPAGANALYVDYLEFRNYLTNFDNSGNLANLYFGPGMKIYYAQLIINGVSWAEKLNQKNGGGLNWVPSYAGAFSSTNMTYPDGSINRLNLALVQSCDLDSNHNGIANCLDPAPVFVPSQVAFAAVFTNAPQHAVVLSWNSIPYAANSVLFKPSLTATNWQLLTNFVLGPSGGGSDLWIR